MARASIPRGEPTNATCTLGSSCAMASTTATPGKRCPPVPPPAMTTRRARFEEFDHIIMSVMRELIAQVFAPTQNFSFLSRPAFFGALREAIFARELPHIRRVLGDIEQNSDGAKRQNHGTSAEAHEGKR